MQKSTGGASPYPKSVIGNDEGGFARTWRTKTYSGREKGGGAKPLVTLSPQTTGGNKSTIHAAITNAICSYTSFAWPAVLWLFRTCSVCHAFAVCHKMWLYRRDFDAANLSK